MQLALRPYAAAAGVVVIGAGLIDITPVARDIEQRAVHLTSIETLSDLMGPIDATLNSLIGVSGSVVDSVADALTSGGQALGAASGDALPSLADLDLPPLLDPAFWQTFWGLLADDPINAFWMIVTQLPVIGPAVLLFDVFVLLPLASLFGSWWNSIADAFGLDPSGAAADGLGAAVQGAVDALPAGVSTALADVTSLSSDVAGALDPTALIQDVSAALDPSAMVSMLDLNPIADIATAIDPAAVADIGTVLSAGTIPDLGEILTTLIP